MLGLLIWKTFCDQGVITIKTDGTFDLDWNTKAYCKDLYFALADDGETWEFKCEDTNKEPIYTNFTENITYLEENFTKHDENITDLYQKVYEATQWNDYDYAVVNALIEAYIKNLPTQRVHIENLPGDAYKNLAVVSMCLSCVVAVYILFSLATKFFCHSYENEEFIP
jgi:hypothetical protein